MLKSEILKIQRLAEKNRKKSENEVISETKGYEKRREKANVSRFLDANEAHRLFSEMKKREF